MSAPARGAAAIVLAIALLAPLPAGATTPDQLYRDGVAARRAGDADRAIDLLGKLVAGDPAHADGQLHLGLALFAAGRDGEAEAALRRTLAIAPGYDDARIGLARIAQRRGDRSGALAELGGIAPSNPEAASLKTLLGSVPLPYRWQIELGGSYSALADGRPDWKGSSLQLRYQANPRSALSVAIETSRRFGTSNTYTEARLDHRLTPGIAAYLTAGFTPQASFRPEWQIGGGGSARLRAGRNPTVATLDARQSRFAVGNIQTLSPGVEQYVAGGKAWLSGRWINIFDERGRRRSGWRARGDLLAGPRLRLFAGVANAPDVSEGIVVETSSLFGGFSADINDRMSLRLSIDHEDRATGTDRSQVALGVGFRF